MKYFRFIIIGLLYLLKDLFYIVLVQPIVEFLEAIKKIADELLNIVASAPYIKVFHEFLAFGPITVTNLFLKEESKYIKAANFLKNFKTSTEDTNIFNKKIK
ncbi:MAG: hypothetical protein WC011_02235 [Candidatus Paceibacterota bacterium]